MPLIPHPDFPETLNLLDVMRQAESSWGEKVGKAKRVLTPEYQWIDETLSKAPLPKLSADIGVDDDAVRKALIQIYAVRICLCLIHEKITQETTRLEQEQPVFFEYLGTPRDQPIEKPPNGVENLFKNLPLQLHDEDDRALLRMTHALETVKPVLAAVETVHEDTDLPPLVIWMFRASVAQTLAGKCTGQLYEAFGHVEQFTGEVGWGNNYRDFLRP